MELLITDSAILVETLRCLGRLLLYIIPCVFILLPIRFCTKLPSFIFRKLLHIVAFTSFAVMLLTAESWQAAALTSVIIAVFIYPLLALLENKSWYARLFVQKSPGEVKRSLIMLFFMFAAVIAVACGAFGKPHAAAAAILMWGEGDAAAALVGIPFGKHKVMLRPVNGRKSLEGSCAMLVVSFLTGFCLLRLYYGYSASLSALLGAAVGTGAELFSDSEWDTVTVPVAILAVMLFML